MSDTSLVFNLVARERVSETLGKVKEKFHQAATGIAAGVAGALGVGVAQALDMSAANAKLAAQLGVGPAEAARLSKVSADVYANAWGDSSETVNEAIRGVYQNIGDVSKAKGGLESITTKALALAETFNQEVGPTTAAAGQLIRTGLAKNADEAFDILAQGFGTSANKADDFLDTLNEYSTQWRRIGLDGQTATGLLSQGLQHGARDADQVADAIGQFGELALSGSTSVQQAFKSIGLDADTMSAKIGKGGSSAKDALQKTLDALRGTKDEQVKLNAATALFGDPGTVMGDALFALDPASAAASSGMDKASGSADRLVKSMGDSPAKTLERFKRQATTKLAEISGSFLQFAGQNKDVMEPLAYTLGGIAATVLVIRAGMMLWTAAQTAWSAATAIATGAQWLWNSALAASPVTWIIIGIIALIAVIVLIATKTHWFQDAWKAMTHGISVAWDWIWQKLKQGFRLLTDLFLNFTGPGLIIKHWDTIKHATKKTWDAVWGFVKSIPGRIVDLFMNWTLPGLIIKHWDGIKHGTVRVATAIVGWVKGLPGKIVHAVSSLGSRLWEAASSAWTRFRNATSGRISSAISLVRGLPGRARSALGNLGSLLYNSGQALIRGFINGIRNMIGSVRNAASSVVDAARDYFPFSPAKVGPFSGRGWTLYSGQSLIQGLADGITQRRGVVTDAMAGVTQAASDAAPQPSLTTGMAPPMGASAAGGVVIVRFEMAGAEDDFHRLMRKITRVKGRGNVQIAFGQ